MQNMQWDDSLSVGVELIDEQHKKWVEHYNGTVDAVVAEQGPTHVVEALKFLIDYTEEHFSTEENAMTEHAYPGLDAHKSKHDELKKTLANLSSDFDEEGVTQPLVHSIDTLLRNWLVDHIKEVDVTFGAFLKEKGIALS